MGSNSGIASERDRVALEVDISALGGRTINSAFLQYQIENEISATPSQMRAITLTAFTANGILGFDFDPPNTLFSGMAFSKLGENSIDVKDFLNAGLATNTGWFGLHLRENEGCCWTQSTTANGQPDAAQVRLIVNYTEISTVPEPTSTALLGLGLVGFAVSHRKFAKTWKKKRKLHSSPVFPISG